MVMALFTKRLPVTPIPEQDGIPPVRHDVVNDRRLDIPSFLLASNAQRICTKECPGLLLPTRAVPFLCCCPLLLTVKRCVLGAVLTSVRNQPCTARVLARCVRSSRHCFLPSQKPAGFPTGFTLSFLSLRISQMNLQSSTPLVNHFSVTHPSTDLLLTVQYSTPVSQRLLEDRY